MIALVPVLLVVLTTLEDHDVLRVARVLKLRLWRPRLVRVVPPPRFQHKGRHLAVQPLDAAVDTVLAHVVVNVAASGAAGSPKVAAKQLHELPEPLLERLVRLAYVWVPFVRAVPRLGMPTLLLLRVLVEAVAGVP
ncbi:hypothetical protein KPB2_5611 [Klebsiella pneumoniae Kb677]|nr:hypothetical protein KPB2_5611 [Klebsiella pneumoniae Kb677]